MQAHLTQQAAGRRSSHAPIEEGWHRELAGGRRGRGQPRGRDVQLPQLALAGEVVLQSGNKGAGAGWC